MSTDNPDKISNETVYYHSFVPHKYRLLTLIGFVRAHLKPETKIVIACCSSGVAEYNKILFNFKELRCDAVHGKQDQQHRDSSIRRFKTGEVSVLFATSLLLSTIDIERPTWLIHYDIPKEIPDEIKIIKNINPEKFVLFIDESHKKYLDLLKEAKIVTKEMPFTEKKIPNLKDEINKLTEDKNHLLYRASQEGYRDLIQTYVNHEYNDIFNARELNLLDVCCNFGIRFPPKLALSK